jgi:ankyrin repeat protein
VLGELGVDMDACNYLLAKPGGRPLEMACAGNGSHGDEAMMRTLVEAGADLEAQTHDGIRVLMSAAMLGRPTAVRVLVAMGAQVEAADHTGKSALIHAVRKRQMRACSPS